MLTTEAKLVVEMGVDAVRPVDRETWLAGSSNSPQEVQAISAGPVGELSRCRAVRFDLARDLICMDAI